MAVNKIVYDGNVQLPPIPNELLEQYPYAWIRKNTTSGNYDLWLSVGAWYWDESQTAIYSINSNNIQWYIVPISTVGTATEWTFNKTTNLGVGIDTARTVLWSSHDIVKIEDLSLIYFKGDKISSIPTDLTGTVWRFKGTISPSPFGETATVAFEITGTMVSDGYSITLPYTVGAYTYNRIAIAGSIFSSEGSSPVFRCGAYGGGSSDKGYFIVYYNKGVLNLTESGWRYYTYNYSPSVPLATAPIISAPLFTITGGADATNSKLIVWLAANATQVVILPTKITYNGTELAELESGKTATLKCAGKKMTGNVVVAFGSAGAITYDGSTTELEAGKTATLQCAGKKMTTDVYITAAKA